MAAALWRFLEIHLTEGRQWLDELLAMADRNEVTASVRAKALYGAGVLAHIQNDYDRAFVHLELSLALYQELEDKQGMASSLNVFGALAHDRGDDTRALMLLKQGLALCRELLGTQDDPKTTVSIPISVINAIASGSTLEQLGKFTIGSESSAEIIPAGTVGRLIMLANFALAGETNLGGASLADITAALNAVNSAFDGCRVVVSCDKPIVANL